MSQNPSPPAPCRTAAGDGSRRAVPTPLRRGIALPGPVRQGAAALAVAGGALSLVGAAAAPGVDTAPETPAPQVDTVAAGTPLRAAPVDLPVARAAVQLVAAESELVDATELVKAVQLAEQELARLAAEGEAAEQRAEEERIAALEAAEERIREAREEAEQAPEQARDAVSASTGFSDCGLDTSGLGAVKPWVDDAAEFLGCRFGEPAMIGVASRGRASDHPSGMALDLMARGATGDAIAACALQNMDTLGISYVIWKQRINHGSGWKAMEDRGGDTANHVDHVHISFNSSGGSDATREC